MIALGDGAACSTRQILSSSQRPVLAPLYVKSGHHAWRYWKDRVRDRWLIVASKRETLIRHGIARLWWVTSLTFDPKMSRPLSQAGQDPFAYTLRAFQKEDRAYCAG